MNLQVVIPAAHDPALTLRCYELAEQNRQLDDTEVLIFDNGVSSLDPEALLAGLPVIGPGANIGNYPVFDVAAQQLEADVVLFIHSDLLIYGAGYDDRLLDCFQADPMLGLVGFIGSHEIDIAGGRGRGTTSSFQGREPGTAPAELHGARLPGGALKPAAIVDGCAMAFRRDLLLDIGRDPAFPPHHFYDRLLSCEVLARGFRVAVLGVACDHLNGRTACVFDGYKQLARRWCLEHGCANPPGSNGDPDHELYLEAERQFLVEWRDRRRFVPLTVGARHEVYHTHPLRGMVA